MTSEITSNITPNNRIEPRATVDEAGVDCSIDRLIDRDMKYKNSTSNTEPQSPLNCSSHPKGRLGRPRSLSETDLQRVLQLHESGLGYRAISRQLWQAGVAASPWSVRRAVLGLAPYEIRHSEISR